MSQFAVLGLGNFGSSLAVSLANKGHEVLVIDSNGDRIENIKNYVTSAIVYDVKTGEYLKDYISKEIQTVILNLGDTIEANILAIYYLKEIEIKNIIVKAVSAVQADIYRKLGATQTIDPEKMAGEDLAERLSSPNLIEYIPLAPDYGIFEVAIPEKFIGKTIKEIGFRKKYHIQIIAIKDVLNDAISFLPNPDSRIQPDSVILFICRKEDFDKLKF